jgi:bisphosphoglycerate-dependent phosphoglycerate mutase
MNHEIIYTDEYALIVSDEIPDGFYYDTYLKDLRHTDCSEYGESSIAKKVIAHRPLTDAPIIEVVPLLPPFSWSQQYGVEKLAEDKYPISVGGSMWMPSNHDMMQANKQEGFIQGYNKAKETYKYTEEDIANAVMFGRWGETDKKSYNKFIQSLQQPKRPKYFECETITMNEGYTDESDYPYQEVEIPKTITNSQGQTELVGEYIY